MRLRLPTLPALLVAAIACLAATAAQAQTRSRAFEFGVFGGTVGIDTPFLWFLGERGDNGALGGAESSEFWGGRLGFHFTPKWGVELSHDDVSTEDALYMDAQRDFIADVVTLNYNFLTGSQRRLYPYVAGGVGRQVNKVTVKGNVFEDEALVYAVGGGFRMYLNKTLSFRVDGRWKVFPAEFDVSDPYGGGVPPPMNAVPPFQIDDTFANFEVTLGLYGLFGGRK
jgi:hypothetical protein